MVKIEMRYFTVIALMGIVLTNTNISQADGNVVRKVERNFGPAKYESCAENFKRYTVGILYGCV